MSEDEAKMVLSWRNDERIKKWMHTKDDISLESHLKFIKSLKTDKTRDYFIVKDESEYLGVIDLNNQFLGIYANPNRKRVGDILLNTIIEFAFKEKGLKTLKAEVYANNTSAIKLYKRFGFEVMNENGTLLKMELKNENR
jgi:UDP-4-amino-4,6-dideoxy-N-acetyl-beta-L-altrosamine N-acetyltransferase